MGRKKNSVMNTLSLKSSRSEWGVSGNSQASGRADGRGAAEGKRGKGMFAQVEVVLPGEGEHSAVSLEERNAPGFTRNTRREKGVLAQSF